MGRIESTQAGQANCKSKGSEESSIFGSVLGSRASIILQALKHTPPRNPTPNVSPATYFGAQRPAFSGDHMVDTPGQANVNYGMDQRADPDVPRQAAPVGPYPGMDTPGPTFCQPDRYRSVYRMLDNAYWRCNDSTEKNSTMDLAVDSLNGARSLCVK